MPAFQLQSIYSNAAPQFQQHDIPCRLSLYYLHPLNHACLREWMGDKYNRLLQDRTTIQEKRLHCTGLNN